MSRAYLFLQSSLCILILSILPSTVQATDSRYENRTFTLTAINPNYPQLNNVPVVRSNNADPSAVGVGFAEPYVSGLTAFIYNNNLFRYCDTSPTGACIGYYQKNYGGALTGLQLEFWFNENFPASSPCCSVAGVWGVVNIDGVEYLSDDVDPTTGQPAQGETPVYELCSFYGGGYAVEPASNGVCLYGTKFKVTYTDDDCYGRK